MGKLQLEDERIKYINVLFCLQLRQSILTSEVRRVSDVELKILGIKIVPSLQLNSLILSIA